MIELKKRKQPRKIDHSFDDPVQWIQEHFFIPETNRPIELYPSQIVPLQQALSINPDGTFCYSTVVWSAIKKSAKSSIAAALGLWFAWRKPWSTVKVIANDLKQAQSRVFYYIQRAVELNPEWKGKVRSTGYLITLPNHSLIEAIPIDPTGEAGGNDDLLIFSELWGWKNKAAIKMWTEMTLSPMKFGQSMRWCETYAGFTGESPVLEELYEQGVEQGECIDPEYEIYRNGRLFVLWNTKPSLPWQTPEYYEQEGSTLLEVEFDRVHRNKWGSSTDRFVPPEWWDACQEEAPAGNSREMWIVALDAAISGDCFGLIAVCRIKDRTVVRHVRKWTPPANGEITYTANQGEDPMQSDTPEGELARLAKEHNIIEVCYDKYQLHSFCHDMGQKYNLFFKEFSQAGPRLVSDKELKDDIKERVIQHNGDPDLREHVMNANATIEGDNKLRIVKRSEKMKVDLCVCLSMSNHEAKRLNL